jgi:chorismate synthase
MVLYNRDQQSEAYEPIKDLFRPGHADYTYHRKYGSRDWRGSGRASGRETAARVAGGAVAKKLLSRRGIEITAYTARAAGIVCEKRDLSAVEENPMRACDAEAAAVMMEKIEELRDSGDSAGGIVECLVRGLPEGIGEPVFAKLDAELARAVVSIGAVKGVEFGAGFAAADMRGSEHNDPMGKNGYTRNNSGGVIGGISNGEELVFRAAVKPTSSISVPQQTVDIHGTERPIITEGRHDPCICPRIVPVVEAMTALVLIDLLMQQEALSVIMDTERRRG